MSKHTPGPWKAKLYLGGAYAIYQTDNNEDELGRIAVVHMIPTMTNASLIAAAPELLEALKSLLQECKYQCEYGSFPDDRVELPIARAAIAKAEAGVMP